MVLLPSRRIPRAPRYSGYSLLTLNFAYETFTPYGARFHTLPLSFISVMWVRTPQYIAVSRFGLFPFRSPLLRKSFLLSFPLGNEMFQFPRFPPHILFYSYAGDYIAIAGFPHSDICGSMFICNSPQLFAACHVLLRRLVPRHPPYALSSLILFLSLCGLFS